MHSNAIGRSLALASFLLESPVSREEVRRCFPFGEAEGGGGREAIGRGTRDSRPVRWFPEDRGSRRRYNSSCETFVAWRHADWLDETVRPDQPRLRGRSRLRSPPRLEIRGSPEDRQPHLEIHYGENRLRVGASPRRSEPRESAAAVVRRHHDPRSSYPKTVPSGKLYQRERKRKRRGGDSPLVPRCRVVMDLSSPASLSELTAREVGE